jgi:hypothetical protein
VFLYPLLPERHMKKHFLWILVLISPFLLYGQSIPDYFSLGALPEFKNSKLIQISSNDTSGGNADFVPIAVGESKVLANIEGAGIITRIWVTVGADDKYFLRRLLLRMYWDGEKEASVQSPIGDFFGNGFQYTHWLSVPLGMSSGGYYCYFPMPFSDGARLEVVNESGKKVNSFYYQIDYQKLDNLGERSVGRFHAQWRRECRTQRGQNYLILDAEGRGQYVGTILSMQGYREKDISYLEGDEFVYVDGETVPSVRGTGTEDYFTSGWYFNRGVYSAPLHGLIQKDDTLYSRVVAYRFHFGDQIPFEDKIRFTIEHGHGNEWVADFSSVAFWYQREPHKQFETILPPAQRIPLRVAVPEEIIESESLIPTASVVKGSLSVQKMADYGVDWSGNEQLRFTSTVKGSNFTLNVPVREADIYTVGVYITKDTSLGKAEIWIGGKKVADFDAFNTEIIPGGSVTCEPVRVLDSTMSVTFKIVGKNPKSAGYNLGIDALVLTPHRNFVRKWYILGPFPNPGDWVVRSGLRTVYEPEKRIDFKKPYSGTGQKEIYWIPWNSSGDGFVNLNDALKPHDNALAYALTYIYVPQDRKVNMYLGTDDGVRLWVNGSLVHDSMMIRGAGPDQDTVGVRLLKGWNSVLLKIENNIGGWGFYCRIPDPRSEMIISPNKKKPQ